MIELAPDNHIGHECTLVDEIPFDSLDYKVMEIQEFNKLVAKNTTIGSWRWGCYHDNQLYFTFFTPSKPIWATHMLIPKIVLDSDFTKINNSGFKMKRPIRNQTYAYSEICNLYLRGNPHLGFEHQDTSGVIQTSHTTEKQLLTVPLLPESKWTYVRETDEWIPVFKFSRDNTISITDLVDLEKHEFSKRWFTKDTWWATPKGFPRSQEN